MEKIEIEKYIKTFKDEQGNTIGYGIVGNLVELVEKVNNSLKEIEHIGNELVNIVRFNSENKSKKKSEEKFTPIPDAEVYSIGFYPNWDLIK